MVSPKLFTDQLWGAQFSNFLDSRTKLNVI